MAEHLSTSRWQTWKQRLLVVLVSAALWAVAHLGLYAARVSDEGGSFSWTAFGEELGLVYFAILAMGGVGSVLGLAVMGPIMLVHKASLRSKD